MQSTPTKKSMTVIGFICLIIACIPQSALTQETERYSLDETYSISESGTVHLKSDDARVEIIGSDRSDVHLVVNYYSEFEGFKLNERTRFGIEVNERNGDLVIREKDRKFSGFNVSISRWEEEYTIRLEVPKGVSLDIEGDDDHYDIIQVNGSLRFALDDAELSLRNYGGNDMRIKMDDGEVEIDEINGTFEADIDDATLSILRGNLQKINIDGDDSDIVVNTVLMDNGSYRFDFDDGDLELGILGGGGRFVIDHDNVNLRVRDSFEEIEAEDDYSEYRLAGGNAMVRIRTDDGDITLRTR